MNNLTQLNKDRVTILQNLCRSYLLLHRATKEVRFWDQAVECLTQAKGICLLSQQSYDSQDETVTLRIA